MPNERALRETKVQLRMRPLQKDVIARAAQLKQTTITNFIVEQAFHAAQQILADRAHFYLSPEKWNEFCAAMEAPPRDVPALRKLFTEPGFFNDVRVREEGRAFPGFLGLPVFRTRGYS